MKKKIILVLFFLVAVTVLPQTVKSDPIDDAYETDESRKAKIKLTSSKHVEDFGVNCIPTLGGGVATDTVGACTGHTATYSASTFEVDMGDESGAKYWGYCLDPGYAFGGGSQGATCSRRTDPNLKYLADAAGTSHKEGGNEGKIYELALRLLGMEANYSNSAVDKEVGRGLNQAITYLEQSRDAYDQALQECGLSREKLNQMEESMGYDPDQMNCVSQANKRILVDNGLDQYDINTFITGEAADLFRDAYWLLRDVKNGVAAGATAGLSGDKPAFELDLNNIECAGSNYIKIPIVSRTIPVGEAKWTTVGGVLTVGGDGHVNDAGSYVSLTIDNNSTFNCDENGASFGLRVTYAGGTDGDMYVCTPNSGNQQSILVYTGASSKVPGTSNNDKTEGKNTWTIPIPSCASSLLDNCTGCSPEPAQVKTQGGSPNCCSDGGASGTVQDTVNGSYDIDQLFGKNIELNLEHQKVKCEGIAATKAPDFSASNAQSDTATMRKYCTMYCIETSSAHVPGPVEVTAGRYFKLPIISEMNVSERRDCRIQTKVDQFIKDYKVIIQEEVDHYNNFQKTGAQAYWLKEVTEKYIDNATKKTKRVKYTCKRDDLVCEKCRTNPITGIEKCTTKTIKGATKTAYSTLEYYYIDYSKVSSLNYPIKELKLEEDTGENKNNSKLKIVPKIGTSYPSKKGKNNPSNASYWTYDLDEDTSAVDAIDGTGEKTCSSSYDNAGDSESFYCYDDDAEYDQILHNEYDDIESDRDDLISDTEKAGNKAHYAAVKAKKYEESMYECENYFTEGDGANVGNHYKINISSGMSYDLVYNKDNGEVTSLTQNGKIKSSCGMGVGEADSRAYAQKWGGDGNPEISIIDFSDTADFDYENNKAAFDMYLDDEILIDKSFKVSGTYSGGCSFSDQANTYNTLFAGGLASPILTPSENFTGHSKVYHLPLTNYTGRMEIRYNLGGFGSQVMRNFDSQFLSGSTCSGLSKPGTGTVFSCYYDSQQKLVTTGRCRDGKVVSYGNYMYNCGPYCDGNDCDKIYNFNFKTVDPAMLFPNGTQNGTYAKNWVLTKEGKIVQSQIEHDDTFNPSNLTYSYSFTSNDLTLIKKYNESRIGSGGYSDFKLTCKCGKNGSNQTIGTQVCHECISEFLTNLYDKKIVYNGVSHNLNMDNVWGNDNLTLNQIRGNGYNHWSRDIVVENPR